jgi:hypothetical protein
VGLRSPRPPGSKTAWHSEYDLFWRRLDQPLIREAFLWRHAEPADGIAVRYDPADPSRALPAALMQSKWPPALYYGIAAFVIAFLAVWGLGFFAAGSPSWPATCRGASRPGSSWLAWPRRRCGRRISCARCAWWAERAPCSSTFSCASSRSRSSWDSACRSPCPNRPTWRRCATGGPSPGTQRPSAYLVLDRGGRTFATDDEAYAALGRPGDVPTVALGDAELLVLLAELRKDDHEGAELGEPFLDALRIVSLDPARFEAVPRFARKVLAETLAGMDFDANAYRPR